MPGLACAHRACPRPQALARKHFIACPPCQIAFLPVVPWCHAPPPERPLRQQPDTGVVGFVRSRVEAALDEAGEVWNSMKEAEEGTLKNRLYKLGSGWLQLQTAKGQKCCCCTCQRLGSIMMYVCG